MPATVRRAGAVAVSGAVLTLVALMFDAAPLFVPGVALAALGVLTPVWIWLAARGITVRRTLAADRVIEDEPVEAMVEVTRGPLRPPGVEPVNELEGETLWDTGSPSLRGSARSARVRSTVRFHKRGRHTVPAPAVIVRDPLDLARVVRTGKGAHELLVLPRVERVNWLGRDLGSGSQLSAGSSPAEPIAASELDGLRPYRVGTPATRIHWAALARGQGLMERRMKADADTRPLVVLDARCSYATARGEGLDAAIRAAASLTLELARRGGCGLLLPGERRPTEIEPELRAWAGAHSRLALFEGGPLCRVPALSQGARLGRVFYVAAEVPRRLPHALLQNGALAAVLVIPKQLRPVNRAELTFEVAGCRGYLLATARRGQTRRQLA